MIYFPSLIAGLLLIDIGETFEYPVGVVGQMFTISQIVAVTSALILGILSTRIKHKTLLISGIVSFIFCSLGCYLAPNFSLMLIFFSFSGLGMALVMPMVMALVGKHFPLEKRASAIGWISISMAISSMLGGPLIGLIEAYAGWRSAFILLVLPLSLLALSGTARWLPTSTRGQETEISEGDYLKGLKEVLGNRSALACLLGYALSIASFTVFSVYGASYFRESFQISATFMAVIMAGVSIIYIPGSFIYSRLVDRFGRKPTLIFSLFSMSILIIILTNVSNLWFSLVIISVASMFSGVMYPASNSLTLEQVPNFRGTMMSLNSAAENIGMVIGSGIGGLVLLKYNFQVAGTSLGALGIIATFIYQSLVTDPTVKTK
jgi:DHA1 family purine base/nucleoside efflux pump-like MFS transporter